MKKLYIIIALTLWGFAQTAGAQNMYRNYLSSVVGKPTSAVSVVHSNGYVYFFQADGNGMLSATEIDPLSMLPTGNANYFVVQQNSSFHANGGFEDAGGYFVLFGNINNHPAFIRIASNLLSCDVSYDTNIYGEFTAGCDGFTLNMDETYIFVNGRNLTVVNAASISNSSNFELDVVNNPYGYFSDISWDDTHGKFIATGLFWNPSLGCRNPFVDVFELVNFSSFNHTTGYYLENPPYTYSNEYKTLHVQLDDDNLLLYYDLRHIDVPYAYDVIWLTRILNFWNNYSATVTESWYYELPCTKLSATDMIYDPYNYRLNFLGYLNKCREGLIHILAQVNPYMLSSGIEIGQLGATFTGGTCLNDQPPYVEIPYNDLKMFNLALNDINPCDPVLIAGVDKQSVLTETYDISISSCDSPLLHEDKPASPVLKPYTFNTLPPSPSVFPVPSNAYLDNITMTYICDEPNACSHQFGGKSLQQSLTDNPTAEITVESGRQFVCEGFDGKIYYSLYDVTGKQIQQGIIQNGESSSLKVSNGLYFIQAKDAAGNQVVKKVVVTN